MYLLSFNRLQKTFFVLLAVGTLLGCKKDEPFENYTATIESDEQIFNIVEGESIEVEIRLSEVLSEDLPLQMNFPTQNIAKYINPNDYDSNAQISVDNGGTWQKSSFNAIKIPALHNNIRIRLQTIDDRDLEYDESFFWEITPVRGTKFTIHGSIDRIQVYVRDNESNSASPLQDITPDVIFEVGDGYQFHLVGINRDSSNPRFLKEIIDEGLPELMQRQIRELMSYDQVELHRLEIVFDTEQGIGGWVYNEPYAQEDRFTLGVNLAFAYIDFQRQAPQGYNADGQFGYILVHEFGHLLTLSRNREVDPSIPQYNCNNLYLREGCFYNKSLLNKFSLEFYSDIEQISDPNSYVSDYAMYNIAEDIAETFSYYIHQQNLPELNENSSVALQKLHFAHHESKIMPLKAPIRNLLNIDQLPDRETPVRAFNRLKNGKQLSCLDLKRLEEAYRNKAFMSFDKSQRSED